MTILHVTQNVPKRNSVQWTGSNLTEVRDFCTSSAQVGEDQYNSLLVKAEGADLLQVPLNSWIVGEEYWGDDTDTVNPIYAEVYPDYWYQLRFS